MKNVKSYHAPSATVMPLQMTDVISTSGVPELPPIMGSLFYPDSISEEPD